MKRQSPKADADIIGKTFGHQIVLRYWGKKKRFHYWWCKCECGKEREVKGYFLVYGYTISCGCIGIGSGRRLPATPIGEWSKYDGLPEYESYCAARTRCNNPNHISYKYYGGRGIEFRVTSFEEFYLEVGDKPTPSHSIDRIDVNGHYELGNLKWSTAKEQMANQRKREPETL